MSNASVPDYTVTFNTVLWCFSYIILPICFVFGNIGNCFNLLIFSQRSSRSNSCLLYFFSASIINIFILNFGLVLRILRGIWNIDPAVQYLWFCRFRTYLTSTLFLIYRYSILFACIDRMCASSRSPSMRTMSRPKVAHRLIIISWILCAIYFIPALIFSVILYGQCLAPPNTNYATFLTISTLIQALFIPLAMTVSGLIIFIHLRSMHSQVEPVNLAALNERRGISQYITMLFVQVGTDCLCNAVYSAYLIYSLVFPSPQTGQIAAISTFLINMSFNVPYLNYASGFYLYTLSSPSFRRKLLSLLRRITWFQQFIPLNNETHNTHTIPMVAMHTRNTAAMMIHPPIHII